MSDKTPTPAPQLKLADAVRPPIPMPGKSAVDLPAKALKGKKTEWNTKNLGMRLGADLLSAATAASLVAPVISIVDRLALHIMLNCYHSLSIYNAPTTARR